MIDRYTRPEMAALWTKQKKFETWLEVELNATDAWVKLGKVPAEAAAAMRKNAKFTVERVEEIEQSTRHDVVAFSSTSSHVSNFFCLVHSAAISGRV